MITLFASALAALVIGHPVPTTCGPFPGYAGEPQPGWAGWYDPTDDRIYLAEWMCPDLERDPRTSKFDLIRFAYAAYTYVHEAEHARGLTDEHKTSCQALRDLPAVLKHLHVRKAGAVLRVAKQHAIGQLPPYGGPCRNGDYTYPAPVRGDR